MDGLIMKRMRQRLATLLVVGSALSLLSLGQAADEKTPPQPAAGGTATGLRGRMQQTAAELNLTDEQKEKVKPLFQSLMEKMRGLREDSNLSPQQRMEKLRALREEFTPQVKKVLTPEQFEKWQTMQPRAGGGGLQAVLQDLNLTDEQKEKLKPIFQEQMEKVRELRRNQSMSRAEKLEKLKEVLSAERSEKVQKRLEQAREQMEKRLQQQKQN